MDKQEVERISHWRLELQYSLVLSTKQQEFIRKYIIIHIRMTVISVYIFQYLYWHILLEGTQYLKVWKIRNCRKEAMQSGVHSLGVLICLYLWHRGFSVLYQTSVYCDKHRRAHILCLLINTNAPDKYEKFSRIILRGVKQRCLLVQKLLERKLFSVITLRICSNKFPIRLQWMGNAHTLSNFLH